MLLSALTYFNILLEILYTVNVIDKQCVLVVYIGFMLTPSTSQLVRSTCSVLAIFIGTLHLILNVLCKYILSSA